MEKLNEYLQSLLSSCSEELRLEPDKNPYLVAENRTTDVGNIPLMGPQISMLVFPLIPPAVKSTLPNRSEVQFVHPHELGNFDFTVQKSPAGFIVTIRPMINDTNGTAPILRPSPLPSQESPIPQPNNIPFPTQMDSLPKAAPTFAPEPEPAPLPAEPVAYDIENSSASYDLTATESVQTATVSELVFEQTQAPEYTPAENFASPLEVVGVNDLEFQTVFPDTANYELAGQGDDLELGELISFETDEETPLENFDLQPAPAYDPLPEPEQVVQPAPVFEPLPQSPIIQPPPAPAPQVAFVTAPANVADTSKMDGLFHKMAELGASDLHLSVSMPPMIRKDGKMRPLRAEDAPFTSDEMQNLITSIMPARNQEEFALRSDTDFAYEIPGLARFRCNVFMDRKGMGAVFRIIPSKMTTASQIGLSEAILNLCGLSKGLVVVTGPTGSGKSTTLCAMVNEINLTREEHIITIEDPIEFVHENHKCLVNQREVHNHTDSFKDALRAALREDPDIVLVGEMRDLETISIAIETAETGHLVFGTLHTTTAASTVDRIIDQFPADRQQQIRVMLSESLKGVIAQTLLPKKGGGRVAALEILIVTPAISNLIREGKTFQIPSAMQTGKNHGMVMLNEALYAHVESGAVEPIDAYIKSVDKTGFETMLTRGGFKL
jgi:twitching motility protein PilT